jgi:acyl-ACP thioesterase
MNKVGVYDYSTEVYSLDFMGKLTIPALCNYLLHSATKHAYERGYGYSQMVSRNTTWVLSRMAIEILNYKRLSEPIRIFTWIDSIERIFTNRCFEVCSHDGETLAYSRSVWAAINIETRRPTSLGGLGMEDYVTERPCRVSPFHKFSQPDLSVLNPVIYDVKYSDLDINRHLSSIKYIESMLDLFDISYYENSSISGFGIIFNHECRYGMRLKLYKEKLDDSKYITLIVHEDKTACSAEVTFSKRI